MHLREKLVDDVVLQREFQFLDVACVASIEVPENNLDMGVWHHN